MQVRTFKAIALLGCALALVAPMGASARELPKAEGLLRWSGDDQVAGFRNIDAIFPTRVVKRGKTVKLLPLAPEQISPVYRLGDESGSVDDYMARDRIAGLLVISKGRIVLEKYGQGQTPADRWISFSIAKSVTSTLLGAAISDGKIGSVDDLVTAYIPELKGSAYDGVTLRQVLAMRSGAQWNEDYVDPDSDVGRIAASMAANKGASLIGLMAGRARAAEPGSRFLYSTGESNMVGIIVSRAVGEPLADYLSRKIWAPYGMESDASWLTDGGTEIGGCCVNMTLRDYGRFGQFMLDGGVVGGESILPPGWISEATSSQSGPGETPYGYQWWIPRPGTYAALGIFGQAIYTNPAQGLIIVQLSAWPAATGQQLSERRLAFVAAVEESLRDPG
ncbi:serine hydrolase domain-containing protein [Sphingopyxis fribergensis]